MNHIYARIYGGTTRYTQITSPAAAPIRCYQMFEIIRIWESETSDWLLCYTRYTQINLSPAAAPIRFSKSWKSETSETSDWLLCYTRYTQIHLSPAAAPIRCLKSSESETSETSDWLLCYTRYTLINLTPGCSGPGRGGERSPSRATSPPGKEQGARGTSRIGSHWWN